MADIERMEDLKNIWLTYIKMPEPYADISNGVGNYYNSSSNSIEKCGDLFAPKNARLSKLILRGWVDSEYMYAFPATNIDEAKALYDGVIDWEWGEKQTAE